MQYHFCVMDMILIRFYKPEEQNGSQQDIYLVKRGEFMQFFSFQNRHIAFIRRITYRYK
jgi:hypothetical protein